MAAFLPPVNSNPVDRADVPLGVRRDLPVVASQVITQPSTPVETSCVPVQERQPGHGVGALEREFFLAGGRVPDPMTCRPRMRPAAGRRD